MMITSPRFTARVSSLVPDDFIVMDGKTGRQVMNGKEVALVLDTMDAADEVARVMNERVATLATATDTPRDEDNDGGYDSDDYSFDPPMLLSMESPVVAELSALIDGDPWRV